MKKHLTLAVAVSLALAVGGAAAQSYPTKPIRVVVGFAPGGSVDLVARTLGQKLTGTYNRQVVVDNRPGAASHIGGNVVAKADPDGYTLLVSSQGGLGTNLPLYKSVPYNALKDLTPLALLVHQAQVMVVNPTVPAKSVQEFIALAKAKPGAYNYGSAGVGGPLHMATELFSHMTGIKLTHVLYKGGALALIDLVSGQLHVTFQPAPEAIPYIKQGRIRALAVTTPKRSGSLPDLPTVAESGVPGYSFISWMGLAGPAGMRKDLAERISADWNKALTAPDVQQRLVDLGLDVAGGTPEQLGAFMRSEVERTAKLVKAVGIPQVE